MTGGTSHHKSRSIFTLDLVEPRSQIYIPITFHDVEAVGLIRAGNNAFTYNLCQLWVEVNCGHGVKLIASENPDNVAPDFVSLFCDGEPIRFKHFVDARLRRLPTVLKDFLGLNHDSNGPL